MKSSRAFSLLCSNCGDGNDGDDDHDGDGDGDDDDYENVEEEDGDRSDDDDDNDVMPNDRTMLLTRIMTATYDDNDKCKVEQRKEKYILASEKLSRVKMKPL